MVLDRSTFFPEGGGQYGDTGWLDDVEVLDTQEKDGVIWHQNQCTSYGRARNRRKTELGTAF